MNAFFTVFFSLLIGSPSAFAATHYIDFADGDNGADGLSHQTAWKHSPGDKNATGTPAAIALQPGDILHFKGGVTYFGEIVMNVSGSENRPIILDGNTDGSFGDGQAIFDGAQMIVDWQQVASAEQVDGNQRWKKIMFVDLEIDLSSNFDQDRFVPHRNAKENQKAPWQRFFLIDGERHIMPIAQRPKPSDPFYPDLPADFYRSLHQVTNNYPHKIYYEEGSKGNASLPLLAITYGGKAPVIQPFNGGAVSVEMQDPATIAEIGFTLFRPKSNRAPEQIVFLADNQEIYTAQVDPKQTEMQRFKLPKPVKAGKLTFRLVHSDPDAPMWTKLQQIAAFTSAGDNVIEHVISSGIFDEEHLIQQESDWYDGMFVGVHGGNNHVYFARVNGYDPKSHQLRIPHFQHNIYADTKYALYNSPKFIDLPGEWCVAPLDNGRSRVFLLPERVENGQPINIGYPALKTAVMIKEKGAHIEVRGFLMQRFADGAGGVATQGRGDARPAHIRIADCEIRFMSGQSGISLNHSDYVAVENCYVHHCPGWTVGIYVNRTNHYRLSGNRLDKNSGSGIRHYESKHGVLKNNVVLDHYGMHSSGLNFYEGCADILFEGNYVQNVIAINRNAKNLTFRNNVVDSGGRAAVSVAMWSSGRTGGQSIKNLVFENNTFINTDKNTNWSTAIFVQSGGSAPEGLIIRNNILDRLRPPVPGTIEGNLFMRETDSSVAGSGSVVVEEAATLFFDPENGDYRRKADGPMLKAGADISPPSAKWQR